MKKILYSLALAALFATSGLAETKEAVFTVKPQMSCQNCENKIKSNLRFEKGVKKIETSLTDQTVTVTYDDTKTNSQKIIAGLKKVGYTAEAANGKASGATKQCCKGSQKEQKCEGKCENSGDSKCKNHCGNHK